MSDVDGVEKVEMILCPKEYCCQSPVYDTYNECAPNRVVPICGECRKGYSESLFKADCIKNEDCSFATWFWVVIVSCGAAYVLFFVFQQEWKLIVQNFSEWLRRNFNCRGTTAKDPLQQTMANEIISDAEASERKASAFLQIFMYYIQISSLLTLDIIYIDGRDKQLEWLSNQVKTVFSFNTFSLGFHTCLFEGTTSVLKIFIKLIFIFYLFVAWFIMLLVVSFCKCGVCSRCKWTTAFSVRAKFLGALISLLLYTYQYFAEDSLSLLKCITIDSTGDNLLYIDGHMKCYQDWQYGVIALAVAPPPLKANWISVKVFII